MKFYRLTQIMCLLNPAKWEICMLNTEYFINPKSAGPFFFLITRYTHLNTLYKKALEKHCGKR